MANFKIKVTEIRSKIFEVEANSPKEAIADVVFDYQGGEIQLSNECLKETVVSQYARNEKYENASSVTLY